MVYELSFPLGNKTQTAFLRGGFQSPAAPSRILHWHTYAEIHTVSGGEVQFLIGTNTYTFRSGDLFAVPSGVFHMCLSASPDVLHTAFQTDVLFPVFVSRKLSPALLEAFLEELYASRGQTDGTRISAFLCLLCSELFSEARPSLAASTDHALLIHEFFSHNYREEVSLSELARQLHFSEKHTGRLVLKHTGKTFTQALTAQRMAIAEHLASTTDMSLTEIAQYVGYRSYSGFWKAYRNRKNP